MHAVRLVAVPAVAGLVLGLAVGIGGTTAAHAADPAACPAVAGPSTLANGEADFDGDGIGDVAYGLPYNQVDPGSVLVKTAHGTTSLSLSAIDPGASSSTDMFGWKTRAERLDGDACTDLVISAPGVYSNRGRVYLVFGAAGGINTGRPPITISDPNSAPSNRFGVAIDTGVTYAYARQTYTTLAIGAPGTRVGKVPHAGMVYRFDIKGEMSYGPTTNTVAVSRIWNWAQGYKGVNKPEEGDRFGQFVHVLHTAAGGPDVLVGVPREDVGKVEDAGIVDIRSYLSDKVTELSKLTKGVPGDPKGNELFGFGLTQNSGLLAVGVPGATAGGKRHAGAIEVFKQNAYSHKNGQVVGGTYTPTVSLSLATPHVAGNPQAEENLGAELTFARGLKPGGLTLVAGLPRHTIGRAVWAGAVARFELTASSCPKEVKVCGGLMTQSTPGVPGTAVRDGEFGASVSVLGDRRATKPNQRRDSLVVGAPGAKVGTVAAAGTYLVWGPAGRYLVTSPTGPKYREFLGQVEPGRYAGFSFYR